ncbi:N-6 DNA methylase [Amphibacillus sp. Q70]|uniref:N-6 DNA methylase n=1 Tax=Amphibacillus sp. Q70 TaxID=3453416 RepID=UPI003F863B12
MNLETINQLLGVTESYQAPEKMLELMLDDKKRPETFDAFLKQETDMSYEWFQSYFEDEHSDRKKKKQDFTPSSVSNLLAQLGGGGNSYFEAAAGTGGIMIQSWNQNKNSNSWYQVEELSERSIPFLIFNMAIRGMSGVVLRGDSLTGKFEEAYQISNKGKYSDVRPILTTIETNKFGSVLMNPPFSASWPADKNYLEDERFTGYNALAPKSKADYAFLLHGFHHLGDGGTMAIVLPHGVLFRGNAEGKIRKALLENGAIEAVIGLPSKLFTNTDIPTTILVLRKNRLNKDVLFIDASKEFEKGKNTNLLKQDHINKIIDTCNKRKNVDKFAHVASFEEIKENDFNLNIPRYVDTFEEEKQIDMLQVAKDLQSINKEIKESEQAFVKMMDDLQVTEENKEWIELTKEMLLEN